jgi:hypothetical protein
VYMKELGEAYENVTVSQLTMKFAYPWYPCLINAP